MVPRFVLRHELCVALLALVAWLVGVFRRVKVVLLLRHADLSAEVALVELRLLLLTPAAVYEVRTGEMPAVVVLAIWNGIHGNFITLAERMVG